MLEANQLQLYKGSKAPSSELEKPKTQMILDGLIMLIPPSLPARAFSHTLSLVLVSFPS